MAILAQTDEAFRPAAVGFLKLPNRKRIEELIGNQEQGVFGNGGEFVVPCGLDRPQGIALLFSQARARLDQMKLESALESRQQSCCAQGVCHQAAAAWSQLDQEQTFRLPHRLPAFGTPETEKFTEHLAYLGRGDEVSAAAEGIARRVVADLRMGEGNGHVVGEADGTFGADASCDDFEGAAGGHGTPQRAARRWE